MENILGKQKNPVLLVFMSPGLDRVAAWQLCRMNNHIVHPLINKHHLNKRLWARRAGRAQASGASCRALCRPLLVLGRPQLRGRWTEQQRPEVTGDGTGSLLP